jgi:hypothetical protein
MLSGRIPDTSSYCNLLIWIESQIPVRFENFDPRIRIPTKVSRIQNTFQNGKSGPVPTRGPTVVLL